MTHSTVQAWLATFWQGSSFGQELSSGGQGVFLEQTNEGTVRAGTDELSSSSRPES